MDKSLQIKKQFTSDIVCDYIKENILNGHWGCNQKLPSESELAQLFGVNRSTVRTALQKLSVLGFIETRVGEGSFVKKLDFANHLTYISDFYLSDIQAQSINEYRSIIEVEAARLAMERATKEDLLELRKRYSNYMNASSKMLPLIEGNDPSVEEQYVEVCKYDLAFHEQIVIMAHNDLLLYAFSLVHNSITLHILTLSLRRIRKVREENIAPFMATTESHKLQMDAIISKDIEKFKSAFATMIDNGY